MDRAQQFRQMVEQSGVVRLMGAHNGLGARLVERHGFEGIWASGLEISAAHALPDANILTMTEYLSAASEMSDACALPVVADCDTGYGNSNNVIHAVRRYEAAGIAAICIEDKHFPKVNSYVAGRQDLAPIGEFVGKIMAGKNAQRSEAFSIIARVEALIAGRSQEEALKRAHAYADAGADMILMHSKADTDREIRAFLSVWKKRLPVVIVPTTYPDIDLVDLEQQGVKVVIYANHGLRASVRAMDDVFKKVARENGIANLKASDIVSMADIFELQGMSQMKEDEKKFLRSDSVPTRVIVLAAGMPNDESLATSLGDRPVAMLDINGKSLLERNVETLNACGLQDITVIGGYRHEAISAPGIEIRQNPKFMTTRAAASLLCGDIGNAERVLAIHGDIVFDRRLIGTLLEAEDDIVLVCDDSYKRSGHNRELELAVLPVDASQGQRRIDSVQSCEVSAIGSLVSEAEATHEYFGLASFSRRAWQMALEAASECEEVDTWNVADLIDTLRRRGARIQALVVNGGWKEIHTFQHYREACMLLK
ncbi:MAG: isocitrate lyase/phosphoenolpyruvate mutase family protein [Verrucomicrobia bacterium]|nr:isocitrate lyase/phosphoenolpyruvate mutase family protein [Verrucomicrobiota bacterium]MDA1087151.1 isocitrate lyase/phosphoenolpyruvate mutase family protein [Verrucomicrobiota bacterium]